MAAQQAVHGAQQPDDEEAANLHIRALHSIGWNQAVGKKVSCRGNRQARNGAHVEHLYQSVQARCATQLAPLWQALDHPQHHAGGRHQRTHYTRQKQQPAQQRLGKTAQVCCGQHVVDGGGCRDGLGCRRFHLSARDAVKHHAFAASPVDEAVAALRAQLNARAWRIGLVHHDRSHTALGPALLRSGHQRGDGGHGHGAFGL